MSDLYVSVVWWFVLTAGGLALWPAAHRLCPDAGAGFTFSKVIYPGLISLLLIWFSTLHLLPFNTLVVWLLLLLTGAVSWSKRRWRQALLKSIAKSWKSIVLFELFFLFLLAIGIYFRGLTPELESLEKMMNVGFLNSIYRTDYLPAADMWFAGSPINYYYGGHIAVSVWIKMSRIMPAISYNLALPTVFACTGTLAFQIGSTMLKGKQHGITTGKSKQSIKVLSFFSGLTTFLLVVLGSNGQPIIYDEKSPLSFIGRFFTTRWPDIAGSMDRYWYPAATRFIGYNPDLPDKTIHEFPVYSFIVSDLHAHVINLMFVLAFLLVIVHWFLRAKPLRETTLKAMTLKTTTEQKQGKNEKSLLSTTRLTLKGYLTDKYVLVSALFLALFMIGNYWDFVMYVAVLGGVLLFMTRTDHKLPWLTKKAIPLFLMQAAGLLIVFLLVPTPWMAACLYVLLAIANTILFKAAPSRVTLTGSMLSVIFALAHLIALPFNWHFEPIGKILRWTGRQTSVYQFLILWGVMLLLTSLMLVLQRIFCKDRHSLLLLLLAGFALFYLIVPELVYVVDVYGGDFKRANTMFKFTYQAFILLMLVLAISPWRLLKQHKRRWPKAIAILCLVISLTFLWYPARAVLQSLSTHTTTKYKGLDGTIPLREAPSQQLEPGPHETLTHYFSIIDWLNEHVDGQPTILEAYGPSYTHYGLVSTFTGLPTVLGWQTHEWLWRTTSHAPDTFSEKIAPRQTDVRAFYGYGEYDEKRAFIDQYDIRYVVVGPLERSLNVSELDEQLWTSLGEIVIRSGDVFLVKISEAE